jgi:hypothetical protein
MVYADGLSASLIYPTYQNLVLASGVSTADIGGGTGWAYVAKQGKLYTLNFYLKLDASVSSLMATIPAPVDFNALIANTSSGDKRIVFMGYDAAGSKIFPFQIYQVAGATTGQLRAQINEAAIRWVSGTASWYGA